MGVDTIGGRVDALLAEMEAAFADLVDTVLAANRGRETTMATAEAIRRISRVNAELAVARPELRRALAEESRLTRTLDDLVALDQAAGADVRLVHRALGAVEEALEPATEAVEAWRGAEARPLSPEMVLEYARRLGPYTTAPHNFGGRSGGPVPLPPALRGTRLPKIQAEPWPAFFPLPSEADLNCSALFARGQPVAGSPGAAEPESAAVSSGPVAADLAGIPAQSFAAVSDTAAALDLDLDDL